MFKPNQFNVNPEAGIAVEPVQALGEMAAQPALNYASVVGELPGAVVSVPDTGAAFNQSPSNTVSCNNSGGKNEGGQ